MNNVFVNFAQYFNPSINDIVNMLVDLYEEDENGISYFRTNGLFNHDGTDTNAVGSLIVMSHVATSMASAALGFISKAKTIYDQGASGLGKAGKSKDVEQWLKLMSENPLGIKYCANL